jgi:hypothetical protein
MTGQLCWLPKFGGNGELTLHLRLKPSQPWRPYTAYPEFCIPDYPIARGSRGWATSQKLLLSNWIIIPTCEARASFNDYSSAA